MTPPLHSPEKAERKSPMNHPHRKSPRLRTYNYAKNGSYLLKICTQNDAEILSKVVNKSTGVLELTEYGRIAEKYIKELPNKYPHISVDCCVILPDMIQLLLTLEREDDYDEQAEMYSLEKAMGWLKYFMTKEINKLKDTPGQKVFQRSYFDHIVRNEQDYEEIVASVYYAPVELALKMRR